jgi:protein SCO1/2
MSQLFDFQRRGRTAPLHGILLVCLGFLAACGPSPSAQSTKTTDAKVAIQAKDTGVTRYTLTGRVVSVDKPAQSITVDGDAVPGFMAAMTMPYQVKAAGALEKLSPADQIKAEIVVGNDEAYLENVVVLSKAPSPKPTK